MQKVDLWSCQVGDVVLSSIEEDFSQRAQIIAKEVIPSGFTETHLVRLETADGLTIEVDCSTKNHSVILLSREGRPVNISLKIFIKVKEVEGEKHSDRNSLFYLPLGTITYPMVNVEDIAGYVIADGRTFKKEEWPELYSAIGDEFSLNREIKEFTPTLIESIKKLLKIKFTPRTYFVVTRMCGEDEFRIPDFRGQFIRGI